MPSPYLVTDLPFKNSTITLESVVGASHVFDYVAVYAVGSDTRLYGCTFFNGVWTTWLPLGGAGFAATNLSATMNSGGNAVVSTDENVWIFVIDNSGSLWCGIWGPRQPVWAWAQVMPQTTAALGGSGHGPITSIVGAASTGNGLAVTTKTRDGSVLIFIWDNPNRQWRCQRFPTNAQLVPTPPLAVLGWSHVSTDTSWRNWALNTVFGYMQGELGVPAGIGIAESIPGISQYTSLPVDVNTYGWITILFWAQNHKVYCATMGSQSSG